MRRDTYDLVLLFTFKIGLVTANFDRFFGSRSTSVQYLKLRPCKFTSSGSFCPFITSITLPSRISPGPLGLGIVSLILLSMLLVVNSLKIFYLFSKRPGQVLIGHHSYTCSITLLLRTSFFPLYTFFRPIIVVGVESHLGLLPLFSSLSASAYFQGG